MFNSQVFYFDLLHKFVSFRSISTDPAYKQEMERTVEWLRTVFEENGFVTEIWESEGGNPVVFASYELPVTSPQQQATTLVYGHYDVQPASLEDGWKQDPFVLREEGNRLIGRGVVDNKGQILIHMATVFKLIKENKLKHNVKFLIEGDEETGGGELNKLIELNKQKLETDQVLVSDGEIVGEFPTVEVSLRGGFNLTLTYTTANTNLHSGIFGGAAPNAAMELAKFVAGLYDKKNLVTVPGFYDDVDAITPAHKKNNRRLEEVSQGSFASTGIKKFLTEKGLDFYTQTGLRPSISVTGFKAGYISEGYANIVPASAEVRLNFRLVASQDPEKILEKFKSYVAAMTPEHVEFKIVTHGVHYPIKLGVSGKGNGVSKSDEVRQLLKQSHGKEPLHRFVGGAIPVVSDFKNILGADTLLIPLCNDDCNMHGVEENFRVDLIEKGLDFSERFFQ